MSKSGWPIDKLIGSGICVARSYNSSIAIWLEAMLAVAVGLFLASSALAQVPPPQNEFFVGVGDASLMFTFEELAVTLGTFGIVSYGDTEGGVQVVGGYQRRLNAWASAGVTASWAGGRRTMYFLDEEIGEAERRMITVMADARAHWFRRPAVEIYSGVALGMVQYGDEWGDVADDESYTHVGFHVTPVGVRVGRDLGVFAELGVGWHNFLKAGLSGRW